MADCSVVCEVEVNGKEDVNKLMKVCCAKSSPTSIIIKSLSKLKPSNQQTNTLLAEQLQPCSNSNTDAAVEALLGGPLTQVINPANV